MNKMYIGCLVLIAAAHLNGAQKELNPMARQLFTYTQSADQVINTIDPLANVVGGTLKENYEKYKRKIKEIAEIMKNAVFLVDNIEDIIAMQSKITEQGNLLGSRLKCVGNTSGTCAAAPIRCSTQNRCIAVIFKNTKDLVAPVVAKLVASAPEGTTAYDNGALLRLGEFIKKLPVSADYKPKVEKFGADISLKMASFASSVNGQLDLLNSLAAIIDPLGLIEELQANNQLTPEKQTELAKVEPIALPAASTINPAALDTGDL